MNPSELPQAILDAVGPLFEARPMDQALGGLVVASAGTVPLADRVARIVRQAVVGPNSSLAAGLWLYVDQLDLSHRVSQQDDSPTGSYWHAIMHRLEGDFSNSRYWLRKTGIHPAMAEVDASDLNLSAWGMDGYDAGTLVDAAEAAHRAGTTPAALISLQRREWWALFAWCARQSGRYCAEA